MAILTTTRKKTTKRSPAVSTSSKFRYYEVTQTTVVRALNATDAVALTRGKRGVTGQIIDETSSTTRITADQARTSSQSA